jgi:hypothetical protein
MPQGSREHEPCLLHGGQMCRRHEDGVTADDGMVVPRHRWQANGRVFALRAAVRKAGWEPMNWSSLWPGHECGGPATCWYGWAQDHTLPKCWFLRAGILIWLLIWARRSGQLGRFLGFNVAELHNQLEIFIVTVTVETWTNDTGSHPIQH